MVTGSPTSRIGEEQPYLRGLPCAQSAIVEQALTDPDLGTREHACAVAALLRELNLDYECITAAVLHTRQQCSGLPVENIRRDLDEA